MVTTDNQVLRRKMVRANVLLLDGVALLIAALCLWQYFTYWQGLPVAVLGGALFAIAFSEKATLNIQNSGPPLNVAANCSPFELLLFYCGIMTSFFGSLCLVDCFTDLL